MRVNSALLVEIYQQPINGNLFVVGDIHGCYAMLMQQLEKLEFNFETDLLVSVGDIVDRGPDSLKCFELLSRPWFKAIRGNDEQFCIEGALAPEMQPIHCKHGGGWLYELDAPTQESIIARCKQLPIILEIKHRGKKYGFVHADIHLNDWELFKQEVMQSNYFSEDTLSAMQIALWHSGRIQNQYGLAYQQVACIDEIYLGHTVLNQPKQLHNCFFIDTGAVFGGKLTVKKL